MQRHPMPFLPYAVLLTHVRDSREVYGHTFHLSPYTSQCQPFRRQVPSQEKT
jgi:hypothetical protein